MQTFSMIPVAAKKRIPIFCAWCAEPISTIAEPMEGGKTPLLMCYDCAQECFEDEAEAPGHHHGVKQAHSLHHK